MNTPETNRFPCDCGGEEYHEWQEDCSKPNPNMPTQQEEMEKRFDERFLTKSKCCNADVRKLLARKNSDLYCKTCGRFCKEIEKTKADEIKSFLQSEISLAVAQREKEIFRKIKDYDFKENHLCGFNDGEQDCECFIAGLNVALSLITKHNDK